MGLTHRQAGLRGHRAGDHALQAAAPHRADQDTHANAGPTRHGDATAPQRRRPDRYRAAMSVAATPDKTFSFGDLVAWQRDGERARPVSPSERQHVFSTVTHSSLTGGSPPMQPGGLFVAIKARR